MIRIFVFKHVKPFIDQNKLVSKIMTQFFKPPRIGRQIKIFYENLIQAKIRFKNYFE